MNFSPHPAIMKLSHHIARCGHPVQLSCAAAHHLLLPCCQGRGRLREASARPREALAMQWLPRILTSVTAHRFGASWRALLSPCAGRRQHLQEVWMLQGLLLFPAAQVVLLIRSRCWASSGQLPLPCLLAPSHSQHHGSRCKFPHSSPPRKKLPKFSDCWTACR